MTGDKTSELPKTKGLQPCVKIVTANPTQLGALLIAPLCRVERVRNRPSPSTLAHAATRVHSDFVPHIDDRLFERFHTITKFPFFPSSSGDSARCGDT